MRRGVGCGKWEAFPKPMVVAFSDGGSSTLWNEGRQ